MFQKLISGGGGGLGGLLFGTQEYMITKFYDKEKVNERKRRSN